MKSIAIAIMLVGLTACATTDSGQYLQLKMSNGDVLEQWDLPNSEHCNNIRSRFNELIRLAYICSTKDESLRFAWTAEVFLFNANFTVRTWFVDRESCENFLRGEDEEIKARGWHILQDCTGVDET